MLSPNARAPRSFVVLVMSGLLLVMTSCGTDDGFGKRYSVSGTVTYNGKPLEKGEISFVPDDPTGVGATGTIENGSYTLSTGGNKDGARAGKYKVTISAKEDVTAKAKADFAKEIQGSTARLRPKAIHGQRGGHGQEPDPCRLRRYSHHDPHGRGQGTIQHHPLRALRCQRPARATGAGERQRPQMIVVVAGCKFARARHR